MFLGELKAQQSGEGIRSHGTDTSKSQALALADALRSAEYQARAPEDLQLVELSGRLETAYSHSSSAAEPDKKNRTFGPSSARQKQAVAFLAGIGAVTVGKFALALLLTTGGTDGNMAAQERPHRASQNDEPSSAAEAAISGAEIDVRRFGFTSRRAFADAAAQPAAGQVSLARPLRD